MHAIYGSLPAQNDRVAIMKEISAFTLRTTGAYYRIISVVC